MRSSDTRLSVPWTTAPAANIGVTAPPFTWRRFRQNALWPYLTPLIFLVFTITWIPGTPPALVPLGWLYILALAVGFVGTNPMLDTPLAARLGYVAGYAGLVLLGWTWLGPATMMNALFVTSMLCLLLPFRLAIPLNVLWSVMVVAVGVGWGDQPLVIFGSVALGIGLATAGGLRLARSEYLLTQTRIELERAMLAAERERIARDVHDVLGHSLTALAVKADLVERLIPRDREQALAQVRDVQAIARQSLADMRATTTGLREVSLAGEIASARAVLDAAQIDAVAPSAVDPLDEARNTVFGYVVREAVTNVARHSRASWCRIEVSPTGVTVSDDGEGISVEGHTGSGLKGLRERLAEIGGHLVVAPRDGGGTVVRAVVPAPA